MKSLQLHMNWNRAQETSAGPSMGTMTLYSVWKEEQPSMAAASSRSRGTLRMNWISW